MRSGGEFSAFALSGKAPIHLQVGGFAMKNVYTVVENGDKKSIWVRIGVAFDNKDGSLNVRLNALPVNGKLHIRERSEKEGEAF